MADETVTEPVNTAAPEEQATTPAPEASAATPAPTPSPASMPKPHAPSPAAFAKKTPAAKPRAAAPAAATAAYSEADVKAAEAFGRVDDNGTVFVKDGDAEREVGQFPDVSKEEALALYARRFLVPQGQARSAGHPPGFPNIKAREIDESVKLLGEETSEPAVVGDLAALKTQYEELKAAGEAKKTEIAEARKAAQAKAVAERTAIVEKAEALAASLGDNTNWRSTADKFRNLFDEWQNHQRTTVRIDKPEAEALWKRFSVARTTFNQARRKWAQARDNERTAAKEAKEAIIAEANELKDSTAWGETSRKFNDLMDRWKKAGRAGRNEDDELWAKFREAADTFFNARQADRRSDQLLREGESGCQGGSAGQGRGSGAGEDRRRGQEGPPGAGQDSGRVGRSVTCRVTICAASRTVSTPLTSRSRPSRMPLGSRPIRRPTPASPASRSSSTPSSPSSTPRSRPNPTRRRRPSSKPRRPPRSSG